MLVSVSYKKRGIRIDPDIDSHPTSVAHLPPLDPNVQRAVRRAVCEVAEDHSACFSTSTPVVLICGTAFIMSAARAELGIVEPRDSEVLSLLAEVNNTSEDSKKMQYLDSQV